MLAGMRSCILLFFLLALVLAACIPVAAQVNGVPSSVTSIGFGGKPINGVAPSVTSLGPNGYGNFHPNFWNCCANLFMPANPNPPLFFEHHQHHKDGNKEKDGNKDRSGVAAVGFEPIFIPYAVPYVVEPDYDSAEADDTQESGPRNPDLPAQRTVYRDAAPPTEAAAKSSPVEPEVPVAPQPTTVLVYKDGHKSDVVNYAIVGDTLFDFGDGRSHKIRLADLDLPATQKANDDRGVDFQVPASANRK